MKPPLVIFVILFLLLPLLPLKGFDGGVSALFPKGLEDSKQAKVDASTVEGKVVALYFSAHWCPPCRAFTPQLVKFRNENADKGFEVVFISFDNSNREKQRYIKEAGMPWPSLPGARSGAASALARKFQIRGYPTLVVLLPDGSVASSEGVRDIMQFPNSALEKWTTEAQS